METEQQTTESSFNTRPSKVKHENFQNFNKSMLAITYQYRISTSLISKKRTSKVSFQEAPHSDNSMPQIEYQDLKLEPSQFKDRQNIFR